MAQIGTLGDIVFTVSQNTIKTFNDLQIQSQVNYAKHTRHNIKPLLEFQNQDTDTGSFSIYLSAYLGINPLKEQKKVDEYMNSGKILPLIIGGKKYGTKWVIKSHSKGFKQFDGKGNLLIAESKITLEEYPER